MKPRNINKMDHLLHLLCCCVHHTYKALENAPRVPLLAVSRILIGARHIRITTLALNGSAFQQQRVVNDSIVIYPVITGTPNRIPLPAGIVFVSRVCFNEILNFISRSTGSTTAAPPAPAFIPMHDSPKQIVLRQNKTSTIYIAGANQPNHIFDYMVLNQATGSTAGIYIRDVFLVEIVTKYNTIKANRKQ